MTTFANATSNLSKRVEVWDLIEQDAATASGAIAKMDDLKGDVSNYTWSQQIRTDLDAERATLASLVSPSSLAGKLEPALREIAGSTEVDSEHTKDGDINTLQREVFDYMDDNDEHVLSRGQTYGTPSAGGSNTGNGSVIRLTVDESSWNLEGWFADAYALECVSSRGVTDEEFATFELSGTAEALDNLNRDGSGIIREEVKSLTAIDSRKYISNPSFTNQTGTSGAAPTAVTGWTVTSAWSNFIINDTQTYRAEPSGGTNKSRSLKFTANDTITQKLSVKNAVVDFDQPFAVGFALYRADAATGTLTVTLGAVSKAITIGSETDDSWTWHWLVATPGANNWPANWTQNDTGLSFALTSLATGTISIDDIVFAPMTRVGAFGDAKSGRGAMGQYMAIVGGSTPWVKDDVFTFTDTDDSTRAKIQFWSAMSELGYFPAVANATQVTAAGGRTLTFADTGDTITASSGSFVSDGYKVGMLLTVAGSSSNNGTFTLTAVSATVLTVESGDLADEGPLSATCTLNATPSILDQ